MTSHDLARILLAGKDCEIAVKNPEDDSLSEPSLGGELAFTPADEALIKKEIDDILEAGLVGPPIGRWPSATAEQEAAIRTKYNKVPVITIS